MKYVLRKKDSWMLSVLGKNLTIATKHSCQEYDNMTLDFVEKNRPSDPL